MYPTGVRRGYTKGTQGVHGGTYVPLCGSVGTQGVYRGYAGVHMFPSVVWWFGGYKGGTIGYICTLVWFGGYATMDVDFIWEV